MNIPSTKTNAQSNIILTNVTLSPFPITFSFRLVIGIGYQVNNLMSNEIAHLFYRIYFLPLGYFTNDLAIFCLIFSMYLLL